jgi:iron complex outermembrane recepter protein
MDAGSWNRLALGGVAWCVMSMAAQATWADAAAPSATVSEVVVTGAHPRDDGVAAAKTATPLMETPQSISVIDRAQLDLLGVGDLNQALRYTAGVSPETRGSTAVRYDQMNIRGFSPDQYLDGLRLIGSANGYAVPQIDITRLDRIEVVKGPASVLYGQASPGGLVAMTSKLPTDRAFGEVELSGGDYGYVQGAFDLGGPLTRSGDLLFRLDGMASRSDTQIRLNEAERVAVSPAITWKPDARTSWTLLYSHQFDPKAGAYGSVPAQGSLLPNPNGRIAEDFYDGEPGYERFRREQNAISSFFVRDLGGGWALRQNTRYMQTTTSYRSVYGYGLEADLATLDRYTAAADELVDALTLDNQLTGGFRTGPVTHSVIFGVDYQNTRQTEIAGFGGPVTSLNVFSPAYGAAIADPATTFDVRLKLEQTGVYGQDQMALGGFRLMLGGRYDWVDAAQLDRIGLTTTRLNEGQFSGRAGLLYLFDDGLAPYVSYSTSFQPQTATTATGSVLPPTKGKQAEIGLKYQPKVWDTLLTVSLYDLRQTNVATGDPVHPGFSVAAGEVRSRGVEVEGRTRPIPALQLTAAYTWLDNRVTKDNSGLVGTHPYGVPQSTASGLAVYTWQGGFLAGASLGGGVRHLGRSFNGAAGASELIIPPATLFDLVAAYDLGRLRSALRGATLDVSVTNLTGVRYVSSCYSTVWCWYGPRRSAQATLRYRW